MKVIFGRTKIKPGSGVLLTQIHIGSIKKILYHATSCRKLYKKNSEPYDKSSRGSEFFPQTMQWNSVYKEPAEE
jgi:hypothetical protein